MINCKRSDMSKISKDANRLAARKLSRDTASDEEMSIAGGVLHPSSNNSQRVVNKAVDIVVNSDDSTWQGQKLAKEIIQNNPTKAARSLSRHAKNNADEKKN